MDIIASKGIANTASINIYSIDESEETLKAGINNQKPRAYKIYYTSKGPYFNFRGIREYLGEYIRV